MSAAGATPGSAAGVPVRGVAVLAPGYGGTAKQPILRRLATRLEAEGIVCARIAFSFGGGRPSRGYTRELDDLRAARDALAAAHPDGPVALVGRSFGGRMCAFLAEREPPEALVVIGHPIAPPGRPRPEDERALAALVCPTLVVQGDRDELGPLAVLERIAGGNPRIDLVTLAGAGHDLRSPGGSREAEAVEHVARWLASHLR